jgi:hypothetical protein
MSPVEILEVTGEQRSQTSAGLLKFPLKYFMIKREGREEGREGGIERGRKEGRREEERRRGEEKERGRKGGREEGLLFTSP